MSEPNAASAPERKLRLGFVSAAGILLVLVVFGHGLGAQLAHWAPWLALRAALVADWERARAALAFSSWTLRDVVTAVLMAATLAYVIVWRELIARFFRSMYVGVALVVLTTIAITLGVLVPQIENFEDPRERVNQINEPQYVGVRDRLRKELESWRGKYGS